MVEFHVVRCAQCHTFQVHQVKKIQKWKCKLCGEKQSVLKDYGRGTGAECRRHVQKLNTLRGEMEMATEMTKLSPGFDLTHSSLVDSSQQLLNREEDDYLQDKRNQWDAFIDKDTKEHDDGDEFENHSGFNDEIDGRPCITTTDQTFFKFKQNGFKKRKYNNRSKWSQSVTDEESALDTPSYQSSKQKRICLENNPNKLKLWNANSLTVGQDRLKSFSADDLGHNVCKGNVSNKAFVMKMAPAKLSNPNTTASLQVEVGTKPGFQHSSVDEDNRNSRNLERRHEYLFKSNTGSKYSPSPVALGIKKNNSTSSKVVQEKVSGNSSSKWNSFLTNTIEKDSDDDDSYADEDDNTAVFEPVHTNVSDRTNNLDSYEDDSSSPCLSDIRSNFSMAYPSNLKQYSENGQSDDRKISCSNFAVSSSISNNSVLDGQSVISKSYVEDKMHPTSNMGDGRKIGMFTLDNVDEQDLWDLDL